MSAAKVMVVFGTRPEAVKMAPIIGELNRHQQRVRPIVVVTAQHRDMLDQVMELFNLHSDHDLNIMRDNQSLADVTSEVIRQLDEILRAEPVDFVLVQGDTTTSLSAALCAFYHRIPVGHVEAGLRTWNYNCPFPEEMNRVLTSRLSELHFAPTEQAKQNLLREGVSESAIEVTGNTVIDALLSIAPKEPASQRNETRQVLVTAHRRENFGAPLDAICSALIDLSQRHHDIEIVFPVHPNPNVRESVYGSLDGRERIRLTDPLDYQEFAREMARSYLILTDSGGIQEEAPSLGVPVLVLRNETERPEGIEAGTCRLVGTERSRIVREAGELLTNTQAYAAMANSVNPYGDGTAANRIVEILARRFSG